MDDSLKLRLTNQIFRFEAVISSAKEHDSSFTLDFEKGRYRQDELVGLIRDIVPFFALTAEEISCIDRSEWNRQSFTRISDASRNSKGDYGELLLYILLTHFYDTPKFVTKARLRSTTKEQIKGFDCAHFSICDGQVTLWLGEAKFHKSLSSAVAKTLISLEDHLNDPDRIKSELKLLGGEIEINKTLEPDTFNLLKSYVSGGKSLDKVDIAVPVLVTYDSRCINGFCGDLSADIESASFCKKLKDELEVGFKKIYGNTWPSNKNMKIVFFLFPLESVSDLKEKIASVEAAMRF